jgi:triacylglycerol lipase
MPNPAPNTALTLTLAAASLAAYADYQGQSFSAPANYRLLGRFTGWDGWLGPFDKEEKFGLIFESISAPASYIVAFRGTDSTLDIIEDSFWDFCDFTPFRHATPALTQVSTGFSDIYLTKGGTMTASMQQQIFALLPAGAAQVYVTGHSLGAAISQVFTLDMALSSPGTPVQTINFASPRVGGSSWQAACDATGATGCITRVINYHDLVPDYPLQIMGYTAIGAEFEVAFRRLRWWEYNELSNHSMLNLQTVLTNALPLTPPAWTASFPDHVNPGYTMSSTPVPPIPRAQWQAKLQELHATASTEAADLLAVV